MPDYKLSAAADVTPEILALVEAVVEGWYREGSIDWEDVWDRVDGTTLADDSYLDLGDDLDTPAMRKIQDHVRALRRDR